MLRYVKGALLGATDLVWAGIAIAQDGEQPYIGVL